MPHFLKRLATWASPGSTLPHRGLIDGTSGPSGGDQPRRPAGVDTIRIARDGLLTIVYVFNRRRAPAWPGGGRLIIAHMGLTVGGSIGLAREGERVLSPGGRPAKVQAIGEAAGR